VATAAEVHKPGRRLRLGLIIAVIFLIAGGGLLWWYLKPHTSPDATFTGYVVSDDIYMSSPVSGILLDVAVKRGARVAPGDSLFRVDTTVRAADADRAAAQLSANQALLTQQQSALVHARAELAAAQAQADRNGAEVKRLAAAQHEKAGAVSQLQLEQAQAAYQGALDERDAARTQVQSASATIDSAHAQVREAQASLASAQRQLSDLAPLAPSAGRIEDIMFKPGESVTANTPVVSIVPDGEVKVRFYVPEAVVHNFPPGRTVAIGCDGCPAGMTASVDFVATRPEYTPPIIYSLDARQKLVFLVEAVPSNPGALIPGQPMDVGGTAAEPARR
jgi:HlyD family secretion protein